MIRDFCISGLKQVFKGICEILAKILLCMSVSSQTLCACNGIMLHHLWNICQNFEPKSDCASRHNSLSVENTGNKETTSQRYEQNQDCRKLYRTNDIVPLVNEWPEWKKWRMDLLIKRDLRDLTTNCNIWIFFGSWFD